MKYPLNGLSTRKKTIQFRRERSVFGPSSQFFHFVSILFTFALLPNVSFSTFVFVFVCYLKEN